MNKRLSSILTGCFLIAISIQFGSLSNSSALAQNKSIPAPADVLGFNPGDDRKLASWAKFVEYFQKLAAS